MLKYVTMMGMTASLYVGALKVYCIMVYVILNVTTTCARMIMETVYVGTFVSNDKTIIIVMIVAILGNVIGMEEIVMIMTIMKKVVVMTMMMVWELEE
mmetsp:Transcript_2906/g.373  ORF Transcript_2906/g.373 Transcript_2906/m.373 type:complete len:98 (+) Transcript_2906:996-1289(+)